MIPESLWYLSKHRLTKSSPWNDLYTALYFISIFIVFGGINIQACDFISRQEFSFSHNNEDIFLLNLLSCYHNNAGLWKPNPVWIITSTRNQRWRLQRHPDPHLILLRVCQFRCIILPFHFSCLSEPSPCTSFEILNFFTRMYWNCSIHYL